MSETTRPADIYAYPNWLMTRLHHIFETAFYNILKILENPPRDDLANFLGYCEVWASFLIEHHDTEETIFFPALNKKLDFSEEVDQHRKMHAALDEFLEVVLAAKADQSKFDAARLTDILRGAEDNLVKHLHEELEDLKADNLKPFTPEEISDMMDRSQKHAMEHATLSMTIPFLNGHTPAEYKNWLPLPWVVRNVMLPVAALRHRGYWKYAPESIY